MASSEVMESPGMVDSSFYVELSAPEGWSKKVEPRMAGTPKRKGVVYVAPNGEKIRNKRQLEKYLKVHQGGLSSADFDWSTGATPRRSARLSSKGRQSSDSTEVEPAPKRPKVNGDEEATVLVSTRKSSRKKSSSDAVVTKDEAMEGAENRENEKRAVADDVVVSPDVVEKVAPIGNESLEEITATAEKHEAEELAVTTGGIELGDHAEQVPSTEELPSVGHSEVKVNAEEKASKTEEIVIVTMAEATVIEEVVVTVEQLATPSLVVPSAEDVVKPSEGETLLIDVQEVEEVEDRGVIDALTTEKLDRKEDDSLEPKEQIESQGIHALIEEPDLLAVTRSPERSENPFPAAEPVGEST